MKNTEETAKDVKSFIREQAKAQAVRLGMKPDDAVIENTSLVDSGLFDSFSFVALLSEIEKKYSIELDLSEHEPSYFTQIDGLALIIAGLVSGVPEKK